MIPANSFTCVEDGASCTNDGTVLGCCRNSGAACTSTLKTTCVDFAGFGAGKCNAAGPNTLCCSEAAVPYCFTYTLPQTKGPLSGRALTLYDCAMQTGTGALQDFPPAMTMHHDSVFTTINGSIVALVSDLPTGAPSGRPVGGSGSGSSAGSGPNMAAIIGGVVGGVGGLALIAAAAFFLLRRRSASRGKRARSSMDDSSPYGGAASSLIARAAAFARGGRGDKEGGLMTEKEGWVPGADPEVSKKSGIVKKSGFLGGSAGKYTPLAGDGEQTAAPYDAPRESTEYRGAREVVQVGGSSSGPYAEPLYDPMPPKEARRASYMGPSRGSSEYDAGAMSKESRRISMGPLVAGGVTATAGGSASIAPSPMPSPTPSPNMTPTPTPGQAPAGSYSPPMEYRAYRGAGGDAGMQ